LTRSWIGEKVVVQVEVILLCANAFSSGIATIISTAEYPLQDISPFTSVEVVVHSPSGDQYQATIRHE